MAKKLNVSGVNNRLAQAGAKIEKEQKAVERTEIIPIDSIEFNSAATQCRH